MTKLKQCDNECVCGGLIIEDGIDKEDYIPQYKCKSCGRRWYNEGDL